MQMLAIERDGTTTIQMTDAEAHQLRDALASVATSSSHATWTLQRLLSHAHGDTEK
jgi:hypothetical protein